jgi:integrase
MAIKFYTQSKKEHSSIYARVCEGKTDAKARTLLNIKTDRLVKGKILTYRIISSDNAEAKAIIRETNDALNDVQKQLDKLEQTIYKALNNRSNDEVISSQWLKGIVQPTTEANLFNSHIKSFLESRKLTLKPNSYKAYSQASDVLKRYQIEKGKDLLLTEINLKLRDAFFKWLDDNGYSNNAKIIYINVLSQIIRFAKKRGENVDESYIYFKDNLTKDKTLNVYLSFEEIERIQALKIDNERDSIARDWLVISCFTAQRVGDMQLFDKKNIDKNWYLTVQQTKDSNSVPIRIPLVKEVRDILKKYDGNFPPSFDGKNMKSNYTVYNRAIKRVCRLAELDEVTETLATKSEGGKGKIVAKKKWELISSHVGRRSFATNYYAKGVPTSWIMSVTGHKNEATFLLYIDKSKNINESNMMSAFEASSK